MFIFEELAKDHNSNVIILIYGSRCHYRMREFIFQQKKWICI